MKPTSESRIMVKCISHLERHRRKFVNERLKGDDLRGTMYLALLSLYHNPGGSQDSLCADLLIDKGNAARLCRQLEDAGYITRQQSPDDRRQNMLYLTEQGKKEIPVICDLIDEWYISATEGLTDEEASVLCRVLFRMKDNTDNFS